MKTQIARMLAIVMMLSLLTACSSTKNTDSDLATVQKNGKLIVGITEYEPMDYLDEDGNWTGFDAEFARLFAQQLGVECEFYVLADWGKKFMELDTKQIDAIWNGMTITEEAQKNASITDAYVVNAQVVVMKAANAASYTDSESMRGMTIAVESGSAGEEAATEIPEAVLVPLQNQASALLEVKAGTADACIIDITMANAMTGAGSNYEDLTACFSLTEEAYGVAFRKNSDLTAKFNDLRKQWLEDGTLEALAAQYQLTLAP